MGGPQLRVVVHEPDYLVAERGIRANFPEQHPSCSAGPVNQQPFAAGLRGRAPYPFDIEPDGEARAGRHQKTEHEIDNVDRARKRSGVRGTPCGRA